MGLILEYLAKGMEVALIQFMKGCSYSECCILDNLHGITFCQTGTPFFVKKGDPSEVDLIEAQRGLSLARKFIVDPAFGLVVLDEINVAADYGLLDAGEVVKILNERSKRTTVVLSGRNPPSIFFEHAQVLIEMLEIKHPYSRGIQARKGIDY